MKAIVRRRVSYLLNKCFEPYRNCHLGESGIVFGTGPSLRWYKPPEDKLIKAGLNGMSLAKQLALPIELDYYFFVSYKRRALLKGDVDNAVKFCATHNATREFVEGYDHEKLGAKPFAFAKTACGRADIANNYVSCPESLIFAPVQFMLFTGVKKLYLAGCDCTNGQYFFDLKPKFNPRRVSGKLIKAWKDFKKFTIDASYPDVKIISINPVALDIFDSLES